MKICRLGLLGQPTLLEGRLVLGMALTALGKHDEVLQEMRVALGTDPDSALGWLMKGEALIGKRDFGQAEAALGRARSLEPSNPKPAQLLAAIARARAEGHEEVPIESTGTKEYPARAAANVKWRASSSVISQVSSVSFGQLEENTTTDERGRDAGASTKETATPPAGRISRDTASDEPEREEFTSIDPEPSERIWMSAPESTDPGGADPPLRVSASHVDTVDTKLPDDGPPPLAARPAVVMLPAPEILLPPSVVITPMPDDVTPEPTGVAREAESGVDVPLFAHPPLQVSGPEEATIFGLPRGVQPPPAADSAPPDLAPPRGDRATAQMPQLRDEPSGEQSGRDLGPGRLPSRAFTVLAPLGAVTRPPGGSNTVDVTGKKASGRRGPEERVTREVDALDPKPRSFAQDPGESEPSISLSVAEVVFAPDDSEQFEVRPGDPVEPRLPKEDDDGLGPDPSFDDGFNVQTDEAKRDAIRRRERLAAAAASAAPSAPPVKFVAPVPLEASRAAMAVPRDDLHPRIPGLGEPTRGRKPAHLGHPPAEPTVAPPFAAPVPPPREVRNDPRRPLPSRGPAYRRPRGLLSHIVDGFQPPPGRGTRSWVAFGAVIVAVIATGVVAGLLVREWRLRVRVERRHELAQKKLTSGNFPGYQAAELLYRQILTERDDRRAAALRAKVLAQLSFEFGEAPEPAQRAVQALGTGTLVEEREARVYLALAKGELELAARQAAALLKDRPGPSARYLLGQAQLLLDQPEDAANALRTAAAEDPQNPLVLHALGVAEAALRHNDRAFEAYGKALTANANHVATIIDRALLQLHQGLDREAAAGSLEGVVGKLVGDASPGQLARAYVGIAEIELGKGNVAAARSALSSAAARRRDHPLLLEELAKAYADAFELDPAEREARRALAVSGRLTPRLILAEVALRRSRPVQALTVLEESGGSRPDVLVLRALAKLELGRTVEARADADLAMRLDGTMISAAVALARIDIAESRYDAALRRLEEIEKKGKYAEVAWALGQVYLARRQPDRARQCFREALHRQPLLLQARLALARLLHDAGQLGEAREEVGRIIATNAAYVPARRELAALSLDLGDAIAARDEFDALAERDADLDTLLGGARARLLLGDARGAEERIERAVKLRPSGVDLEATQCLKARALLADHRVGEAIQLLLKVVPTAARGEALALLIEAYIDYRRLDWAERAVELAPVATRTGVELTLAKSRLAIEQARQSAGRSLADEALQRLRAGRSPVWLRAQALGLLGRADFELGNARAAWKNLKSALELDPRNVRAQFELGLTALELKRPEDAVGAFEGALANDPRFAEAQFYLGRTRRELADPRADEALRAYLDLEPRGTFADEARRLLRGEAVTPTSDLPRNRRPGR